MMRCLFYYRDSERGVRGTYEWLANELKELGEALEENNKENIKEELADVIAWSASLANITGIDLERAAINMYSHKCPKCLHSPCRCTF